MRTTDMRRKLVETSPKRKALMTSPKNSEKVVRALMNSILSAKTTTKIESQNLRMLYSCPMCRAVKQKLKLIVIPYIGFVVSNLVS